MSSLEWQIANDCHEKDYIDDEFIGAALNSSSRANCWTGTQKSISHSAVAIKGTERNVDNSCRSPRGKGLTFSSGVPYFKCTRAENTSLID